MIYPTKSLCTRGPMSCTRAKELCISSLAREIMMQIGLSLVLLSGLRFFFFGMGLFFFSRGIYGMVYYGGICDSLLGISD